NKNRRTKYPWVFDEKTDTFVTKPFFDTLAVNVDKIHAIVNIYNQDPCGRLLDNFYTYKETIHKENYIRFCFTNYDIRFYLDVYQPNEMEETEEYIHINSAEKIIWASENCTREFRMEDNKVVIKENATE
ncbi:MAG: hypothetical protein K2J93_04255, partial [Anaeroplasmataceae bacterium]|nr:hypothetical protein [Anaeroplasmataceae bacterium]